MSIVPKNLHNIAQSAPRAPGVYVFRRGRVPLYIGKAADLKKRLASYFRANALDKVRALRDEADGLEWTEAGSEIEALIAEAELIKRHLPKYNVLLRDDKSYFYVAVTREDFPRIYVTHRGGSVRKTKPETGRGKTTARTARGVRLVGPYTSGSALFEALRLLRGIFPYCTCRAPHKRPCLNAQIGRCPGFCCEKARSPGLISGAHTEERGAYGSNIKNILAVLGGRKKHILSLLKRHMREAARCEKFEAAGRLRDRIAALENIFSHRHVLVRERYAPGRSRSRRNWRAIRRVIAALAGDGGNISRVEGYDISNVSGTAATGSMVVFVDGAPAKSLYRKFKIKTVPQANDVAMHREMMRRRLSHPEWGMPDMIVIDGGLPQMGAVREVLRPGRDTIILSALAKREEELYLEHRRAPVRLDTLPRDAMLFFQHVRDESHRFAKKYHHKLREISYREDFKK